jgi:hypothetical protein
MLTLAGLSNACTQIRNTATRCVGYAGNAVATGAASIGAVAVMNVVDKVYHGCTHASETPMHCNEPTLAERGVEMIQTNAIAMVNGVISLVESCVAEMPEGVEDVAKVALYTGVVVAGGLAVRGIWRAGEVFRTKCAGIDPSKVQSHRGAAKKAK